MTRDLKRSVTLGLGTLVLLALIGIGALTKDLSRRLGDVAAAATDNVQWVISQVEVEYLIFHAAVLRAEVDGAPVLADVRTRFDVLYSRIGIISQSSAFEVLRDVPTFRDALAETQRFLDETVPAIDGDDTMLLASLYEIEARSSALRDAVRTLGLTGITHFALTGDERREGVEATLIRVIALSAGLIALLILVSGLLLFLVRRLRRSSEIAESARARLSAIVSSSLDAVIVANTDGEIVEFNESSERIFGFRAVDVIGRKMSDTIVPAHLREAHDSGMRRYLESRQPKVIGAGRVQLEAVRQDGALFPVELSIASASTEDEEVFVSFLRDITDRLADEAELRETRDRALAGERAKAKFIAVMSHEMRTPLNGILGTLELIDTSALDAKTRKYLAVIKQSGGLLLQHVNDVLDISKVDAGHATADIEAFDLMAVIADVVASQTALAERSGNSIDFEVGEGCANHVLGDPRRVRQILLNLVGNAVKFTSNGTVTVSAHRLGAGDYVELQVLDTGIGIPDDALESVFEEFVTLDAAYDRETSGTGLGLAITRGTVELLGGEIGVESELGEGSVFWVQLPLPAAVAEIPREVVQAEHISAAAPVAADYAGKVLVAEDNDTNRLIVEDMLKAAGYVPTSAHNGAEAVAFADDTAFDAILMDISMPKMDGVEAARTIRGRGPNQETPIIAVTAHALPDEIRRFKEAGMDAVMTKPVTRAELLVVLSHPQKASADKRRLDRTDSAVLAQLAAELGRERTTGLVSAFIAQADKVVAHLSSAKRQDITDSALIAEIHRLAGAAATFGASSLHEELSRLEDRGKSGNLDEVWTDLPKLNETWAASRPLYLEHTRAGDP